MLTIRNYSKSYDGILVLSVHELILPQGVYWIKGKNGSGKSTLFKVFAAAIVWFVLILFTVPLLLLSVANFMIWIILFREYFYGFEYQMQNRDLKD